MVEHRPGLDLLAHLILLFGLVLVAYPVWIAFVASTPSSGNPADGHFTPVAWRSPV